MKRLFYLIILMTLPAKTEAGNQLKLIAEHAVPKLIADTFNFTAGPAPDSCGNVYFTDILTNTIYIYSINDSLYKFMDGLPGCSGMAFINKNQLVVCGYNIGRNLYTIDIESREIEVIADQIEGKRFNSPGNLWVDKKGGIYFTDPRYRYRDSTDLNTDQVYYISPVGKNVVQVTKELVSPNGIYGRPEEKELLISDTGEAKILLFKMKKNGTLRNKQEFIANENATGMTVDELGNIYVCSDNIKIYDKHWYLIEIIKTPVKPTNICFGGKDFKTLFITAQNCVYTLKMNVQGNRY